MAGDYGYFGKGASGYAHYMQTFNSTYHKGGSGGGGGNGGCLGVVLVVLAVGRVLLLPFL